jgi:squalene cyclase
MWTETAEKRLKELGLTKEQIDKLSDETNLGANILTKVLLKAKQMELVKKLKE